MLLNDVLQSRDTSCAASVGTEGERWAAQSWLRSWFSQAVSGQLMHASAAQLADILTVMNALPATPPPNSTSPSPDVSNAISNPSSSSLNISHNTPWHDAAAAGQQADKLPAPRHAAPVMHDYADCDALQAALMAVSLEPSDLLTTAIPTVAPAAARPTSSAAHADAHSSDATHDAAVRLLMHQLMDPAQPPHELVQHMHVLCGASLPRDCLQQLLHAGITR